MEEIIKKVEDNKGSLALAEYHKLHMEGDPTYLSWLFGGEVDDWGINMTDLQKEKLIKLERYINDTKRN